MTSLPAESNFLRIEESAYCSYESSRFVIYAAPYEYTSSYHVGSKGGPAAIIRASHFVELYDEELDREIYREEGICTTTPLDFTGKVDEAAVALIEARSAALLADNKVPIMFGAEHTVTLGAVRAIQAKFPKVSVLQIDAHSDLRDSYENNRYSHASVMARIHELSVPIVQVGIRAQCKDEAELIRSSNNIHTLYAHQLRASPTTDWVQWVADRLSDDVYISIDADGFDPSIIPGVGTAEPNGLTWLEGLALLQAVCSARRVVGFDIVECAPSANSTLSEYTLAKLAYKLIGRIR